MSEQLTGRALDRAIAEALFINAIHSPFDDEWYLPNGERLPAWSADANATLAVCAERGWELRFEFDDSEEEITYVAWIAGDVMRPIGSGYMTNEYDGRSTASCQEAAARALLTALAATADR